MRLWVPFIQRFDARNWKAASSRSALTRLMVANSASVSTPLRTGLVSVVVIEMLLVDGGDDERTVRRRPSRTLPSPAPDPSSSRLVRAA